MGLICCLWCNEFHWHPGVATCIMNISKSRTNVSTKRHAEGQSWRVFSGGSYASSVVETLTFFLGIPIPVKGGCSSYSVRPCSCFLEKIFQQIKQKNWVLDAYLTAEGVDILVLCDENNSRINESVVRVQLDTYEVHHQTCHCGAERGGQRGEKAVNTEPTGAGPRSKDERPFTYCRPLQVDKATWELSFPLTWPW